MSRLGELVAADEGDKQLQHQPKEPAAHRALNRGADGPERQTRTQPRKPVEGAPEWQPGPGGSPRGQRVGRTQAETQTGRFLTERCSSGQRGQWVWRTQAETQPGRLLTEECSRSLQAHQGMAEEEEEEEEWSRLHRTDRYQTRRG